MNNKPSLRNDKPHIHRELLCALFIAKTMSVNEKKHTHYTRQPAACHTNLETDRQRITRARHCRVRIFVYAAAHDKCHRHTHTRGARVLKKNSFEAKTKSPLYFAANIIINHASAIINACDFAVGRRKRFTSALPVRLVPIVFTRVPSCNGRAKQRSSSRANRNASVRDEHDKFLFLPGGCCFLFMSRVEKAYMCMRIFVLVVFIPLHTNV